MDETDYRSLLEQMPAVPYADLPDQTQTPVYVGPQIESVLGIDRAEYMADPTCWDRHIHPEDREAAVAEYAAAIEASRAFDFEYRMVKPDGEVVWIRDRGFVQRDAGGAPMVVQGILTDITAMKQATERHVRQAAYLSVLHETAVSAMQHIEEGDLLRTIVQRAASLVGTPDGYVYVLGSDKRLEVRTGIGAYVEWVGFSLNVGEGVAGRVAALGEPVLIEDYDAWSDRAPTFPTGTVGQIMGVPLRSGERVTGVIGLSRPPGESRFTEDDVALLAKFAEIASLSLDNSRLYAAARAEIRQRERAEESLQFLAFHDALTGLPNRALFEELLNVAVARARRNGEAVGVVYMDLDNFKLVNDSLGHAAGDDLLVQAAERLRVAVRDADVVARQGGDEFLVLLGDLPVNTAATSVVQATERIEAALAQPFTSGGTEFYTSASIGISLYPANADDGPTLLRYADAAMYSSKRSGPSHHHLFDPGMVDSVTKLSLTTRLRKAVEQNEWILHYQPIVDLAGGKLVGVEALLRWTQVDGSLVMPGSFIPLVEEMGLIGALGDWVLAEVCRQTKAWEARGVVIYTTFNLSLGQLWQPDLSTKVVGEIESCDLDPGRLVAEITESSAMTDPGRTERILRELKEAGLRLAIDDFGTGHSSLSRLKHLPADILKIDRPFLSGLPREAAARSMVKAIVEVAHGLGMQPMAEGIEEEEQREFLLANECLLGQGFLFSPAMPPSEIEGLAARGFGTSLRSMS